MNKKEKLLSYLQEHEQVSIEDLKTLLNSPESSIRGRVSELRKDGYLIKRKKLPIDSYVIINNYLVECMKHIEKNDLLDQYINLPKVLDSIHIPETEHDNIISKLFDIYNVTQFSSNKFLIRRRK